MITWTEDELSKGTPGALEPGDVVADRYLVGRELGRGGMACIHAAYDTRNAAEVALKVLLPDVAVDSRASVAFLEASRIVRSVRSVYIVRVLDYGVDPRHRVFSTMEHLQGEDLATKLTHELILDCDTALEMAQQIARGAAALHREGIVHRDIKPENCFWVPSEGIVKLIDFGISRSCKVQSPGGSRSKVCGTPVYAAPEQVLDPQNIDVRADVYSMGATLYALLTGRVPFRGDSLEETIAMVEKVMPTPPSASVPDLPVELDELLLKALAKRPEARFGSAQEFEQAIAKVRTGLEDVPCRRGHFRASTSRIMFRTERLETAS